MRFTVKVLMGVDAGFHETTTFWLHANTRRQLGRDHCAVREGHIALLTVVKDGIP